MQFLSMILLTTLIISVNTRKHRHKGWKVNEGASTSYSSSDSESKFQDDACKIKRLAEQRSLLMIGRSINFDGNLTTYVINNLEEIEEISKLDENIDTEVKRGPDPKARLDEFDLQMMLILLETDLEIKKTGHYPNILYTVANKTVTRVFLNFKEPMCETNVGKKELEYEAEAVNNKEVKNITTVKFSNKKSRPRKLIKSDSKQSVSESLKLADHHIVSRDLINKFLEIALRKPKNNRLDEKVNNAESKPFNDCYKIIYLRMKNYKKITDIGKISILKKELIVKGFILDIDLSKLVTDDEYRVETYDRMWCWSVTGDNLVRGPAPELRGPFDPNIRYHKYGFEDDMKPIIGEMHYHIARKIDESIKNFLEHYSGMSEKERKTKADIIWNLLRYSANTFRLTPYNPDQWEKRYPTKEDLDRLKDPKLRIIYENNLYWDIKKPQNYTSKPKLELEPEPGFKPNNFKRLKRSITASENEVESEDLETIVRRRWMEFVLVSVRDYIEADSIDQSLEWSNDLDNLYNQYKFDNWTDILCPGNSRGFDYFLYSKLFLQDRWLDCTVYNKPIDIGMNKELCSALRRIIFSSGSNKENLWLDKLSRPRQFLKDRAVIWKELYRIPAVSQVPKTTMLVEEKIDNDKEVDIYLYSNVINIGSIALPLIQYNFCNKNPLTRAKRDINTVDKFYKQEWFLDTEGNQKCL